MFLSALFPKNLSLYLRQSCFQASLTKSFVLHKNMFQNRIMITAVPFRTLNYQRFFSETRSKISVEEPNVSKKDLESATKNTSIQKIGVLSGFYGSILGRVSKTCKIYLDSTDEMKAKVSPNSRFYYVKQAVDSLSPEEREIFQTFVEKVLKQKAKRIDVSKSTSKRDKTYVLTKREVKELLKECSLAKDLMLKFIQPNNRDRELFLDPRKEESSIGEIVEWKKPTRTHLKQLFDQKLDYIQSVILSLDAPTKYKRSANYVSVFRRVMRTCLIYLDSTPERKEVMTEDSRFYYVKEDLDSLKFEERRSFRAYLEKYKSTYRNEKRSTTEGETTVNNESLKKKRKAKAMISKSQVYNCLSEPDNGPLLKKLIMKFLDHNNPDLQLYLDSELDETNIGKKVKISRPKMTLLCEELGDNLEITRKRFEHLDEVYRIQ